MADIEQAVEDRIEKAVLKLSLFVWNEMWRTRNIWELDKGWGTQIWEVLSVLGKDLWIGEAFYIINKNKWIEKNYRWGLMNWGTEP